MLGVVWEIAGRKSFVGGELLQTRSIQFDGENMTLSRVALVGIEKYRARCFVNSFDPKHSKVALSELPLQFGIRPHRVLLIEAVVVEVHVPIAPARP